MQVQIANPCHRLATGSSPHWAASFLFGFRERSCLWWAVYVCQADQTEVAAAQVRSNRGLPGFWPHRLLLTSLSSSVRWCEQVLVFRVQWTSLWICLYRWIKKEAWASSLGTSMAYLALDSTSQQPVLIWLLTSCHSASITPSKWVQQCKAPSLCQI